jgi:hypothetical protein
MTPQNRLTLILVALALLLAAYLLHTHRLGGIGTILVVVLGVIVSRGINKGALVRNPLGENRSYALRPATAPLIKGLLSFVVAIVWGLGVALAVRSGRLPDNEWTAYGLLFIPVLGLLALAGSLVFKAIFIAQYGTKKK